MEIRVESSAERIESLRESWNALFARCSERVVFSSHAWISSAYRSYPESRPLVLLVYEDKKLAAVFPFALRDIRLKGMRVRAVVHGASDRADYAGFLIDPCLNPRLVVSRVIRRLLELQAELGWRIISLANLSERDSSSVLFRELLEREGFGGSAPSDVTPRVLLAGPFEEAKKVSNVKRRFRKLSESREVSVVLGASADDALVSRLVALHEKSYPGAAFNSVRGREFFTSLCSDPVFREWVEVCTVTVDGELIAAHFGFYLDRRLYYYVPMFDQRYAAYGPGQYLLWRMLHHYRELGAEEFDFLRGGEDYKYQWMNDVTRNFRVWAVAKGAGSGIRALVRALVLRDSYAALGSSGNKADEGQSD
ncbi:MAG: GNAT family N-acetyltransferase [Gammaproteobacteria bacterium]